MGVLQGKNTIFVKKSTFQRSKCELRKIENNKSPPQAEIFLRLIKAVKKSPRFFENNKRCEKSWISKILKGGFIINSPVQAGKKCFAPMPRTVSSIIMKVNIIPYLLLSSLELH